MTRDNSEMLTPGEVGKMMGVNTKTVGRWAKEGKIPCWKTPGGHRRYRREDIESMLPKRKDKA